MTSKVAARDLKYKLGLLSYGDSNSKSEKTSKR